MDCRWFKTNHCRSCDLLEHTYEETLQIKERRLVEMFPESNLFLRPSIGLNQNVAGTRNKAKLAASFVNSKYEFGVHDAHGQFKNLEECPLHMDGINEWLPVLKSKLIEFNVYPYSLVEKKGELKYLIISKSEQYGSFLLRFVIRSKESLDRLRKMAAVMVNEYSQIKVITANIQPEHKAVLEGDEEIVLTEEKIILHKFDNVFLSLGPRSFFQVTPQIAARLYKCVGDLVEEHKVESFLDLFCGVGAFSYFAARSCRDVLGVEISREAIECAQSSKPLNQLSGELNFLSLDVEAFLKNLTKQYMCILVNPPRRGLNQSIIESILLQKPAMIIYSSCNVETLARDYLSFSDGYEIISTQIFDMFPYTAHFETLMVLKRK